MKKLKSELSIFISEKEIQNMLLHLARQIEKSYEGEELVVICPLKGSIFFATDLIRELRLEQRFDTIYLESTAHGKNRILKDISISVKDQHVLIVEEVIDSGSAVRFIMEHLYLQNPKSIKVVTLIDKPSRREIPFQPDYVGQIIDDRYIIGYGTDSKEIGRNYKDIYVLRQ